MINEKKKEKSRKEELEDPNEVCFPPCHGASAV
jgi:hypothetical protein